MMDGPEHSSHTVEGRREGGMEKMRGDTGKMEICVGREKRGRKRRLEETKQIEKKGRRVKGKKNFHE